MSHKGIAASPGIVIGRALLLDRDDLTIPKHEIKEEDLPKEIARFEDALIKTRKEMIEMQTRIEDKMGTKHAEIFDAHLLVLEDRMLIEEVIRRLEKEKRCVEFVFYESLQKFAKAFSSIEDEYLKERAADIQDVGRRVLRNLLGKHHETLSSIEEKGIVIAYDLAPSETVFINKSFVLGFATDIGSRTSHTAIIARSLEIPAIVGLEDITQRVEYGDTIILDGIHGIIEINPNEKLIAHYREEIKKFEEITRNLSVFQTLPAVTTDDHKLKLMANIELPSESDSALIHGAVGIGLYRTEFFYMNRTDLPTEQEHYENYKIVADKMYPHEVVVRTMDLGGDKFLSHLNVPNELNPFMGWRAIRFSLEKKDIFKTQLRAILRANEHGNLKILYPLITNLEELIQANLVLEVVKKELIADGHTINTDIGVGAMIEVPSAALITDLLAPHVDFFSIGTNDLIQYALAVDRVNEHIAYLYDPAHPGVLRFIDKIIRDAKDANIRVAMCGEMASDPIYIPLLIGMGLEEFSVPSAFISEIKKVSRSISRTECQKLWSQVQKISTGKEIQKILVEFLRLKVPELLLYNSFHGGELDST
ncbi:phosphoenolpyruvate--protein phosphotransferase [PVC group bacterium]|nr:phosphoenolpyruvate--protein phosphotransferase [PVC group bacterium]